MGLFKCFASRPALIEDDLQNIDHVADSRPVQELAHQTTQTDDELLGNVRVFGGRQQLSRDRVSIASACGFFHASHLAALKCQYWNALDAHLVAS